MRIAPTALALVLLGMTAPFLAGCAEPDEPTQDAPEELTPEASAPAYAFDCPEQGLQRTEGVCVLRLASLSNQLTEPALAVHPSNPQVMAVAAHAVGSAGVALEPAGARLVGALVFVTEDGGATWTERTAPFAPEGASADYFSDPQVSLLADGTLVLAGLRVGPQHSPYVVVGRSQDLGRTWESFQEFGDGSESNDREWLTVGPDGTLYLSWSVVSVTSHVAWSEDSGATWQQITTAPEGCFTPSAVAFVADRPWIACQRADGTQGGVDVLAVDRAAKALLPVSRIPGMWSIAPRILEADDGTIVVTAYWDQTAVSHDGGQTWSEPVSLTERLAIGDAGIGSGPYIYWSEVDGNALHVLLAGFHRSPPQLPGRDDHYVAHAVFDAASLELVQELRLTPTGPEAAGSDSIGGATPSLGDDWYSMAVGPDGVRMVWTWAGGIDLGHAVPA